MKLRQIVATEGIPGSIPAGTPQGWAAPAAALAEGAQNVGAASARAAIIHAHVADLLQQAKAKAELEQATSQLKTRFADADIALRSAGTDPDQYPAAVGEALKTTATELGDGLTTPEAKAAWQGTVARFAAEKVTAAKYDALTMKRGQVKLLWATQRTEDANTAVNGPTTEERQGAMARGLDRSQEGLATGIYSPDEAASDRKDFLRRVEMGGILRDYNNPELHDGVLATLQHGGFRYIPPDEQARLLETLNNRDLSRLNQEEARQRRRDAEQERERKAKASEYDARALNGQLTLEELEQAGPLGEKAVLGEDYRRIRKMLTEPNRGPSDAETWARVQERLYSMDVVRNPRRAAALRQEINALHRTAGPDGRPLLNDENAGQALGHLQSMQIAFVNRVEDRATAEAHYNQGQAEQLIAVGIPNMSGPLAALDPIAVQARAAALRTLTARSSAFPSLGGKENPIVVADEMLDRYQPLLAQSMRASADRLAQVARGFGYAPDAIQPGLALQAKEVSDRVIAEALIKLEARRGTLNKGQFDDQFRVWTELKAQVDEERKILAEIEARKKRRGAR